MIVAEIGNNHEGSYALAEELIGKAAEAGVDAVKFQTFRTELYVSSTDQARFQRLKSFELTAEQFEKLAEAARQAGLLFISTPFDLESAAILEPLVDAYKIASGDNTFYPLIEAVALTGKPMIVSGGIADIVQLEYTAALIRRLWNEKQTDPGLAILHCVTGYPVEPCHANLGAIATLQRTLGGVIGYSDHTLGLDACLLAVAVGARIIEKHFTLDHDYSSFRDHQLSADPKEMQELVSRIRHAEIMMGAGEKSPQPPELVNEHLVRRSIVARHPLAAGHLLCQNDITWVRPAGGLPPGKEHLLLGRCLHNAVEQGEWLMPDMMR